MYKVNVADTEPEGCRGLHPPPPPLPTHNKISKYFFEQHCLHTLTVYQNAPFNMLNSKYFGREQPCCVELWVNNPRATLTPPLSSSSLSILNPYIRPVPYSRMTHESSLSTCQSEAYYARCPKHPGLSANVIYHLVMCKIRFSSNKQVFMEEGDFVKSKLTASPCMG